METGVKSHLFPLLQDDFLRSKALEEERLAQKLLL